MTTHYESVAEILAANNTRNPNDGGTLRFPYEVGILARGAFKDVIAFGRSLGLDIQVDEAGGILTKSGHIRVVGPWGATSRFLSAWREMES